MNPIKLFAGIAMLSITAPAVAALPPQHQRAAELKAILDHPDLVAAFPGIQPIDRIEYVRSDLYRVTAGECFLYAKIKGKPLPNGMVGARQFDVVLGKVDCPAS